MEVKGSIFCCRLRFSLCLTLVTNQHLAFLKGIFVGKTDHKELSNVFGKIPELEPHIITSFRVRTGHGKPGKSWNFTISFSRPGKSWNLGVGHGKSWKISMFSMNARHQDPKLKN